MFKPSKCETQQKISASQNIFVKLLALLAFAAAIPSAGAKVPANPVIQNVDISANVDEVSLDLVVHDKKNRSVLDLKQSDLAISDNGSPVQIKNFRMVSKEQQNQRLITLVFDRPNPVVGEPQESDPAIMKNAREAAGKIFKLFPEKTFSFSVLSVEGRLRLQSDFTADREVLQKAVSDATRLAKELNNSAVSEPEKQLITEAMTGVDSSGKAASARDRALAQNMLSAIKNSARIEQNQHLKPFLAGLLALAQSQQQIRQRKAIIFFTSFLGAHIDLRTREAIDSVIGSANQAGESIYIIDVNSSDSTASQLNANSAANTGFGPGNAGVGATQDGGSLGERGELGSSDRLDNEVHNDDMKHLAQGTGGAFLDHNHLQKALNQILQDMTTYYVATYDPHIQEFDGKFRPVAVKSLRGGLKIRTESGYMALPPYSGADSRPQPFEMPLLKTLSLSPLPTDVPFRATLLNLGDQPEGKVSTVAVEVPYSSLEIHDDASTGISTASLSILAVVKDQSGMVIERFSEDIPRRRIAKTTEMDKLGAISFARHFNSPPGQYIMESVVTDHYSGKSGAQRLTFEVPASSGTPTLSNLVLARGTEPFNPDSDPSEPLSHGNTRVIPNLSGQLLPSAKDVSIFFSAHSDPHASEAAAITIQVFRDGAPLGGQPMVSHPGAGQEFSTYLSRFSISPPQDGVYEVKAVLSQSGKSSESSTSFTLTGSATAPVNEAAEPGSAVLPEAPKGPLKITFSPNPSSQPTPEEIKSILADAAKYAMTYRDSLPNFMCEQITDRSVNMDGTRNWTHKDKITELLTFFEHRESRITVDQEVTGATNHADMNSTKAVDSTGEFGFALSGVFRPESKTEFKWRETGTLDDQTVQLFDYRVAKENSTFNLRGSSTEVITVGFHGQVVIDSATLTVRRITQIVDDVPANFPIQGVSVSIDYDYVVINNHDYMLPVGAQLITKTGKWELEMNEIAYRDFHRFSTASKIIFDPEAVK